MRTKWTLIAATAIVAVVGTVLWTGRGTYEYARIGTTYAAKQTCSCLFVAGRSLASCKTDYDAKAVKPFKWEVAADSVTISAAAGLISAKAVFEDGFGCHPIN